MNNTIGITSTIPVEIVYAAGYIPVDINNLFISSEDPNRLVKLAKKQGFPDTTCSWICGLYGAIIENNIQKVIGVTGGDCSETIALMEVLSMKGIEVIPFSYPFKQDRRLLTEYLLSFAEKFNVTMEAAGQYKKKFDSIREKIHYIDELLWKDNILSGEEVRPFQLSSSDFEGNPDDFLHKINSFIENIRERKKIDTEIRIGIAGVPPIVKNLYSFLERNKVRVVFSEVERQFSLPVSGDLVESYYHYTYPYGIYTRLNDIRTQVKKRNIDGMIHYIQSFCFRGIENIVLQNGLDIPVLTLQGDLPCSVTETMSIRIEAFTDMLARMKRNKTR